MIKITVFLKKLKNILPLRIRYSLLLLYVALIISALLEMIGLGSIPVFVSILLDPSPDKEFFGINMNSFFQYFGSNEDITKLFAFFVVAIYSFKTIFVYCATFFELKILKDIRLHFSEKLLASYIFKPYIFFINKNSSELSRYLVVEVNYACGFLTSIISISREMTIMFIIFLLLVFFDPLISLSALAVLTLFSLIFFSATNNFIKKNAKSRFESIGKVYKSLSLAFGGIKDLKIYKKENFFSKIFIKYNTIHEKNILFRELIVKTPRLVFELMGVFLIVSVTFFFIYLNKDISTLFPALALIAISIIRLMPSFSSISSSLTYFRSWKHSFDFIEEEISKFNKNITERNNIHSRKLDNTVSAEKAIEIKNLSFAYSGEKKGVYVKNISLDVKRGEMIGIIGKSGAGKSTIANIILKLLTPTSGEVNIYNLKSDSSTKKNNHKQSVAYIPQDIFLLDDTLRRNIAFGEYDEDINNEKIMDSLKDAELLSFTKNNTKGLDLIIGERGIKLSGGERQRVGIARALYKDPEILVMDEATSSLDNFTEKQVMSSIKKLKNKHTIVMIAHRLSTIEICDKIFLIENGQIKDFGKLSELLERHPSLGSYHSGKKSRF